MLEFTSLSNSQVEEKLRRNWLLIPVGSIEQHGRHLPLSVDTDITKCILRDVAKQKNYLIAPEIVYSTRSLPNSGGGDAFFGNIFVSGETFVRYVAEILQAFVRNGASKIVFLNGHYENSAFINEAIELCKEKKELKTTKVISINWWDVIPEKVIQTLTEGRFKGWALEHAGIVETALELQLYPFQVKQAQMGHMSNFSVENSIYTYPVMKNNLSRTGALSSPDGATKEMGRKILDYIKIELIKLIKNMEESEQVEYI